MSDMMNDPKSSALEPIRTEAVDTARPPAQQLRWNARATHRAMEGWQRVKSQEDWERINEESRQQYESGAFLLERLGADRYLDPTLMATIMGLRQRLIAESAITTAAGTMLVDLAVLGYYQAIRGAHRLEAQKRRRRLSKKLMPLADRANRMMIRNLKAIKELRQAQVPAVGIGRADHETASRRRRPRFPP